MLVPSRLLNFSIPQLPAHRDSPSIQNMYREWDASELGNVITQCSQPVQRNTPSSTATLPNEKESLPVETIELEYIEEPTFDRNLQDEPVSKAVSTFPSAPETMLAAHIPCPESPLQNNSKERMTTSHAGYSMDRQNSRKEWPCEIKENDSVSEESTSPPKPVPSFDADLQSRINAQAAGNVMISDLDLLTRRKHAAWLNCRIPSTVDSDGVSEESASSQEPVLRFNDDMQSHIRPSQVGIDDTTRTPAPEAEDPQTTRDFLISDLDLLSRRKHVAWINCRVPSTVHSDGLRSSSLWSDNDPCMVDANADKRVIVKLPSASPRISGIGIQNSFDTELEAVATLDTESNIANSEFLSVGDVDGGTLSTFSKEETTTAAPVFLTPGKHEHYRKLLEKRKQLQHAAKMSAQQAALDKSHRTAASLHPKESTKESLTAKDHETSSNEGPVAPDIRGMSIDGLIESFGVETNVGSES